MAEYADITGRADYRTARALREAVRALSALAESCQLGSHVEDMENILVWHYGVYTLRLVLLDDIEAALAELPENAKHEEVSARINDILTEWGEECRRRYRQE